MTDTKLNSLVLLRDPIVDSLDYMYGEKDGAAAMAVPSSGGGDFLLASATLSASQLNHLFSAPVQLVAAPGAGKIVLPLFVDLFYTHGSVGYYTQFAQDHPQIAIGPTFLGINAVSLNIDSTTSGLSRLWFTVITDTNLSNIDFTTLENQAVFLGNSLGDLITYGAVATSHLLAGGAGYAPGDTGGFNENNTVGTYTVNTVGGGGAVATYTLGTGADVVNGCTVGQTMTTYVATGGGDGNFSIVVDTIAPGNGTAKVRMGYYVVDLN